MSGHALERALGEALGDPGLRVLREQAVGGGCIHNAARLETTAGVLFVKWNDHGPGDVFLREADGLAALRAAGSPLVIPEVRAAAEPAPDAPAFIAMEYLPPPARPARDDEALGRGLAALHRHVAPRFGFPVPTYCGSTLQDNRESASWAEFYGERRLGALEHQLVDAGRLDASDRRALARLRGRLPELLPDASPPSLVHGDLWSGNVLRTDRGPGLVDPACAFCDREMEFGITTLFGGFSDRFFAAYEEAWPVPDGWRERNPLYQLYHLLNHFLIFGGHYGSEARAVLRRYA